MRKVIVLVRTPYTFRPLGPPLLEGDEVYLVHYSIEYVSHIGTI